jgi:hypothetical protein
MRKKLWLLVVLMSGCGAAETSSPSFSKALPSRHTLDVSVPDAGSPAGVSASTPCGTGPAGLYVLTRETTLAVNQQVASVIDTVVSIAQNPPTAVGPGSARWGPFSDGLSPVAWQLVVQEVGPASYAFQLDVRPKSPADAGFQPFLQGASQGLGADGPNQGTFSVDLGIAHQLDPVGNPLDGQLVAAWETAATAREVHLHLAGMQPANVSPTTVDVGAVFASDGSGALVLDANGAPLGAADGLEVGHVASRWNATGAGQAFAGLLQDDAGPGAELTQCWDASFMCVYFSDETPDGGAAEGDPSACVFGKTPS